MPPSAKVVLIHQPSFSGKMPEEPRNKDVRTRKYLTNKEVEALMKAARSIGRHGHRDATLICNSRHLTWLILSDMIESECLGSVE